MKKLFYSCKLILRCRILGESKLNLLENCKNAMEVKRFDDIDAEPLFACKIRGNFVDRLFKRTPWLRINCNKKHKRKMRLKFALFLLPIIIIGVLTGGICVSVNHYKKGYDEFFKASDGVVLQETTGIQGKGEVLLINAKNANENKFPPCLEFYEGIKCDKSIIKDLNAMLTSARDNGFNLKLKSGYISADDLNRVYEEKVKYLMECENYTQVRAEDRAQKMVSNAKYSEYTTGLLVDIVTSESDENFQDSDDYRWLLRNCADYGFILRYPKNKESKTGRDYSASCFRYVGKDMAKKMRSLSKCLEEYCKYLKLNYKY